MPGHQVGQAVVLLAELQEPAHRVGLVLEEVGSGDARLGPQALDEAVGLQPLVLERGERGGIALQAGEPVAVRLVVRDQHDVAGIGRFHRLLDLGAHVPLVLGIGGALVREVAVDVGHVDQHVAPAAGHERLDHLKRVRARMLLAVLRLGVGGLQAHALDQVVARHVLAADPVQASVRAAAERPGGGAKIHHQVVPWLLRRRGDRGRPLRRRGDRGSLPRRRGAAGRRRDRAGQHGGGQGC